jgi:hypothetical protein
VTLGSNTTGVPVELHRVTVSSAVSIIEWIAGSGGFVWDDTYKSFKMIIHGMTCSSASSFHCRIGTSSSYRTVNYNGLKHRWYSQGSTFTTNQAGYSDYLITTYSNVPTTTIGENAYYELWFARKRGGGNAYKTVAHGFAYNADNSNILFDRFAGSGPDGTDTYDRFKIYTGAGNITGGTFIWYGVK